MTAAIAFVTVAAAQNGPLADWKEQPLSRADALSFLESTVHGGKQATIQATISNTSVKDVNLGTHCSSNSNSTVDGKVDSYGNVSGTVKTQGGTNCRENHDYFYWMSVVYAESPTVGYVITARCDVRWLWNHCASPVDGQTDGMVIAREKKDKYFIYIALAKGVLEKKPAVSKYEIVDLKRFEK
jgi:hypothetical protein